MHIQIEFFIAFGLPVRLSNIIEHKQSLLARGVYVLTEGKPRLKAFDPLTAKTICIGKAIRETIFSRCQKHLWSIQDARLSNGKPRSGPGHSFIKYRESINFDATMIWLTPGVMSEDAPYAISCAEEYLLHEFKVKHDRYPWCNSAGQAK